MGHGFFLKVCFVFIFFWAWGLSVGGIDVGTSTGLVPGHGGTWRSAWLYTWRWFIQSRLLELGYLRFFNLKTPPPPQKKGGGGDFSGQMGGKGNKKKEGTN